jgi:serine/threonine-protein kinase
LDGTYELKALLGRGGMGEVYEACHIVTGLRVAVKLLRHTSSQDEADTAQCVARFQREARATSKINSQHIVQVLDAGEDPVTGEPFMVMEYLEGRDLNQVARAIGPFPVDAALRVAAQVCLGLSKAHQAGIVHRDIKPANLYVAQADGVERIMKILDFGIARVKMPHENIAGDVTSDLTRTGTMLGSPHYMAPEQARGLKTVDARADVWSLGVVLYKLLSGRTPHDQGEGGMGDLLITLCCVPPPPLQERAPWVPPEVASIVHRALQIDPTKRYPTIQAMLEAIEALLPEGFELDEGMLVSLSEVERTSAAQLVALDVLGEPGGHTRRDSIPVVDETSDTRVVMSAPSDVRPERATGRRGAVMAALAAAVLIAVGVGVGITRTAARPVASSQPDPASAMESRTPAAPPPTVPAAPAVREVNVRVTSGSKVFVDGAAVVPAQDGTVTVSGTLGSTHQVRVSLGSRDVTTVVAITESGAVPPQILLPAPQVAAPLPRSSASVSVPVAAAAAARPAPAAHVAPAAKDKGPLVTKFE